MQATRTTRSATNVRNERTFRSGPYLEGLFNADGRVDAYLQRQICERIQMARKAAGLTQEDAAGLLNVTVRAYQNYESVRVPFRRLSDIARITGRDEDWLLRGDPKPGASLAEVREELAAVRGQLAEVLRRLPEAPGQPHAETN